MFFYGMQKLSLLDFPGRMCATVFTGGCNFRCPFCHNASLVITDGRPEDGYDGAEIISFLKKRRGILDGLCITGGEPTLYGDSLIDFMKEVKEAGFLCKLDTNGSRPELLRRAVSEKLVDYVAMDIKSSKERYSAVAGIPEEELAPIFESVSYLMSGAVDFEFRTTAVKPLHNAGDFESIGRWLAGDEKYFIQSFKDSGDILAASEGGEGSLSAYDEQELKSFLKTVTKYIPRAALRGI